MKRLSIFLAASMMMFAAGCQKGLDDDKVPVVGDDASVEEKAEVSLVAHLPETKTTLEDGYKVVWNKSDQLAVFNAPTGTEDYSGNLHFMITDKDNGDFSPLDGVEVPFEDDVNYDWFVCSPFRATGGKPELSSPKGQSSDDGYFPIGLQTQTGYNNSAHIGGIDIMVGKATDTRTPEVTLKHLAVLHKFTVTNNSNKPTTITKLTLSSEGNKLFGTFWIDLTSDDPCIDPTKANATFDERSLTVNNGTELPAGESADFYMITAPFTLNAGENFKVTIETSTGKQVIEKNATADIEFKAGTYNTASVSYNLHIEEVEHLYADTFNGTFDKSDQVNTSNTTFTPARWDTYDKGGMTVFDGDIASVNYVHDDNSCLTRQVASALVGMDDLHVRFKAGGVLTVTGIKLHDYTNLNLSFVHTYKASGIKAEYSIDGGSEWIELGNVTLENSAYAYNASYDFTVSEGTETISLRFTASASTPRIDNIKLTWKK